MATLELAIGLSIALWGFVLVLLAELYYLFYWKYSLLRNRRRTTNVVAKSTEGAFNFTNEGLVGSLGSHTIREAPESEISATLFPTSPGVIGSHDNLYMQGVLGVPRVLFTIKEETKEDMESEEYPVGEYKITLCDSEQRMEKSQHASCSKSPSKNGIQERCSHQLQKQWRDPYLTGLLPQQLKMQESGCYWKPASPSAAPMKLSDFLSKPFSCGSSPPLAPGRFVSLSCPRSSPWRSNHTLSASARKNSLRPYGKRQSFSASISNPIFETDEMPPLVHPTVDSTPPINFE